jgi:hypothetical protein
VRVINTVHTEYDQLLVSSYLLKQDDLGVPTIECMINRRIFHKTFCDTGSGVNIIAKVTYEYLFGKEPLYSTYVQLQMADQTFWFPEVIAKDIMVRIRDHYVPTDFMVLDMGEEEYDPLIVLGRPLLNTTWAIISVRSGKVHFQFSAEKVRCYFNSYITYEQPKKSRSRRRCLAQRRKN